MSFLSADVQRRAAPQVPRVDLRPVRQQVLDDQVLVGGGGDLQSRLRGTGSHDRTLCESSCGCFFPPPPAQRVRPHLPVALLQVQAAAGGHFGGEHIRQSSASLRHGDVEESGTHGIKHNKSPRLLARVNMREEFVCSHISDPHHYFTLVTVYVLAV